MVRKRCERRASVSVGGGSFKLLRSLSPPRSGVAGCTGKGRARCCAHTPSLYPSWLCPPFLSSPRPFQILPVCSNDCFLKSPPKHTTDLKPLPWRGVGCRVAWPDSPLAGHAGVQGQGGKGEVSRGPSRVGGTQGSPDGHEAFTKKKG